MMVSACSRRRSSRAFSARNRAFSGASGLKFDLRPRFFEDSACSVPSSRCRVKRQGKNAYRFFTEDMNREAMERLLLETGLRRAIEQAELRLHYQPIVDLASLKTVGAEALVRWPHPDMG